MNEENVPELKGVKMLVSGNGEDGCWHEATIYYRDAYSGLHHGRHGGFLYAKPLPQPWEVPPEGYRLVTEEEREKYKRPDCAMSLCTSGNDGWGGSSNAGWSCSHDRAHQDYKLFYMAVPLDFSFDSPVEELTMEEICKELGREVKIKK